MKNVLKFSLALAALFTTVSSFANAITVKATEGTGKVINFAVSDVTTVHVTIYDANGAILFDESPRAKDGKVSRMYDLSAFPQGTYFLETETGTKIERHQITLSGSDAKVSENIVNEIYKPVLASKNGFVTVNLQNTEKMPVHIKMYDEDNNELYSETVNGTTNLAKRFNVTGAAAQKLTFVISYNNKTFVETVAAR